jgi:steroid 5-alpha reductase family enzyme
VISGPLALSLATSAAVVAVVVLVTFGIGCAAGRHSVLDVAWGLAFGLVALTALTVTAGHGDPVRRGLLTGCTLLWGLRLAGYIAWRNHGRGEDPRYAGLLARARGNRNAYALRRVYLPQAVLIWLISVPVQAGMTARGPAGPVTYLGGAVWLTGLVFEAVGDWQLARFKASPASCGKVMDRGLWRYTRHPNYFGDACVWWGLFLISLGSWAGLVTIFSPLLMTVLLAAGSGKPITESRLASRPGYAEYVARTSGFIPLPPRARRSRR